MWGNILLERDVSKELRLVTNNAESDYLYGTARGDYGNAEGVITSIDVKHLDEPTKYQHQIRWDVVTITVDCNGKSKELYLTDSSMLKIETVDNYGNINSDKLEVGNKVMFIYDTTDNDIRIIVKNISEDKDSSCDAFLSKLSTTNLYFIIPITILSTLIIYLFIYFIRNNQLKHLEGLGIFSILLVALILTRTFTLSSKIKDYKDDLINECKSEVLFGIPVEEAYLSVENYETNPEDVYDIFCTYSENFEDYTNETSLKDDLHDGQIFPTPNDMSRCTLVTSKYHILSDDSSYIFVTKCLYDTPQQALFEYEIFLQNHKEYLDIYKTTKCHQNLYNSDNEMISFTITPVRYTKFYLLEYALIKDNSIVFCRLYTSDIPECIDEAKEFCDNVGIDYSKVEFDNIG